jgi:hypothetical protein
LALGAILDVFSIARTQALAGCSRLALEPGGATRDAPPDGAGELAVPEGEDAPRPALADVPAPGRGGVVPAGEVLVVGGPDPAAEAPVAAVDAEPLLVVTVLLAEWPQPASSSPAARARPSHLQTPRTGLP